LKLGRALARFLLKYRVRRRLTVLYTIAIVLLVLWLLGMISGYTVGNFIYILLVIAVVLFLVGLIGGRRTI
jgi:hypothetical protein